ncbi:hypothetical protein JCM19239_2673 [Vibrio variabilis]|uniref:Uncharacterized protein n=1 Tax=Vibrio variabilis TaxID=990271 RepID=A0ABQ0JNJ2_9VIBR|nr:hypothetical protein JCM19239_2673 [Vibrio variabilis]
MSTHDHTSSFDGFESKKYMQLLQRIIRFGDIPERILTLLELST